ncbi:MAG: type II secretory pathway component PulF [Rhodothermales bacterium]|jgi:type II secretory pathway component PulF
MQEIPTVDPQLQEAFANRMGIPALRVSPGESFTDAVQPFQEALGRTNLEIIALAEELAYLEPALEDLMRSRSSDHDLHRELCKLLNRLVMIAAIPIFIVIALLVFLIPKYVPLSHEMLGGEPLPRFTYYIMLVTDFLRHKWHWLLLPSGALLVWLRSFARCQRLHKLLCRLPGYRQRYERGVEYRWASAIAALVDAGLSREIAGELIRKNCPRIGPVAAAICAQNDNDAGRLLRELRERHEDAQIQGLRRFGRYCVAAIVIAVSLLVVGIIVGLLLPLGTMYFSLGG